MLNQKFRNLFCKRHLFESEFSATNRASVCRWEIPLGLLNKCTYWVAVRFGPKIRI